MPIENYDLDRGTIEQVCANCGARRQLRIDVLELGASPVAGIVAADVMVLPACATEGCGAVECLLRTWDTMPEAGRGSVTDKQRRAVNAIAVALKEAGRSHPEAKKQLDAESTTPPDVGATVGAALLLRDVAAGKPDDSAPASSGATPEYLAIKNREDEATEKARAQAQKSPSP